ncbi:MAG: FtsW/RodA/SpoVE family cell cycle protein [Cellulosilyticaceae bacterium]
MNQSTSRFLEAVLCCIKNKKIHNCIRQEILDHIESLKEEYTAEGLDEEAAYEKAVLQMGVADEIGKELNKAHKPKLECSVLLLIIGIIGIGLIALYQAGNYGILDSDTISFKQRVMYIITSGMVLIATYYFDYRYFERFAIEGYIVGIGLLIYGELYGETINTIRKCIVIGDVSFGTVQLAIPIVMIGYIGIVRRLGNSRFKNYLILGAIAMMPLVLIAKTSFMNALILGSCFVMILTVHIAGTALKKDKVKLLSTLYGSIAILSLIVMNLIAKTWYKIVPVQMMFYPEYDPKGAGYQVIQLQKMRESASLVGNGGLNAHPIGYFPEPLQDTILTFILGSMGWVASGILVFMITMVVIRMFRAAMKIQDSYGRLVNLSIATLFSIQFIDNIAMNLGLFPLVGVSLPFVSCSGTSIIIDIALIGIFLNVYRKKDIVSVDSGI